jgi:hypothetical protein
MTVDFLTNDQTYNKTEEEFADWLRSVDWVNDCNNESDVYTLLPWQETCADYLWNTTNDDVMEFLEDRQRRLIERLAYALWEQEGYPSGKDVEHWTLAEKEVWKIV